MPRGKAPGTPKTPGSGRQKGTPNKHASSFRAALRDYCEQIGADPHYFLADVVADEQADFGLRVSAAKELAQYIEPKLKAVEHSGEMQHEVKMLVHRYGKSDA